MKGKREEARRKRHRAKGKRQEARRKRHRTGSGGNARPGKSGQNRANLRIDGFISKYPVQILRLFRFFPPKEAKGN